ncbi:L,D-transpeptidase [Aureimonas sp. AU4]|uniref:L,D-transpeptidase n=1 Tax=Aureimonas sp. AU4 TaxID=1638163 RepID=UPI000785CF6B|nr:L,D-transpeptidase [Aureimonas sp. AU4]
MRRIAPLALALLAALPTLASARDRQPLFVPRDQAAEAVRQLSPGSGVVPGPARQRVAQPYPAGAVVFRGSVPVGIVRGDTGTVEPLGSYHEERRVMGVFGGPQAPARRAAASAPTLAAFAAPRGAVRQTRPPEMDPAFLPRTVRFERGYAPGTIVIDTRERFLYHVEAGGQARRYGVGVGKDGFGWRGTHDITRKAEWPTWTPPAEMVARERLKGRILPARMEGGEANPLGARALYLGSTLYRIHGTNQPWTIGQRVSSGCIRMRNEDVIELYESVPVGTRVVVL